MTYIDSHAHLTSDAIYPHIDEVLQRAQAAGLKHIFNICTDKVTLERGLELSKKHPWIYQVAATTPHDVEKEGEEVFPIMAEAARSGKLKAVGESGLDYHYNHSNPEIQRAFLKKYLHLALECNLPVVIHCRDAFSDFFNILDEVYLSDKRALPGILHCFTGNLEEAKEVVKRGWYVSLSGIVTFKASTELRDVARFVPLDKLLIETDAPYLAPQSKRGKQNEPAYILETAQLIAMLKGISSEELAKATTENALRVFKIQE